MLQEVSELRAENKKSQLAIVVIPAKGLARVSEWVDPSGSWLSKLIDEFSIPIHVWEYVYGTQNEGSLGQQLVAYGRSLLEDLYSHFTKPEHEKCPLIFICHGTGGLVLKKIATKPVCTLKTTSESVIDGEANHLDICKVPVGGTVYKACVELFGRAIETAPGTIVERFKPYTVPIGLEVDTLRSPSTAGYSKFIEQESIVQDSLPLSSPFGATAGSTTGSFEIVPAISVSALEVTRRDPKLPCFSLGTKRKMDYFCGRQDVLQKMDECLLPSPSKLGSEGGEQLQSFAICGLGGMGKTELAVEFAYTRKQYFEAIFWLSADNVQVLASSFANITQQLGLEDNPQDLAVSRDILNGWLSKPLRKVTEPDIPKNQVPWLMIFDNVDNLDVLYDYWPTTGRGSVLITSRDPLAKHNHLLENGRDLSPLTTTESQTLMQRLTHIKADPSQREALEGILERLGGLPIVIDQMSSMFRDLRLSYIDFLRLYKEEGIVRLQTMQNVSATSDKVGSLVTLWSLNRLSTCTKALLWVISLLDPDEIPEDILLYKNGNVESSHYPKTLADYLHARAELLSSSLIKHNAEQQKISLHRLTQETARATMSKSQLSQAFQTAIQLVMGAWPFQSLKEHHWIARFPKCETILPSILRLKSRAEEFIRDRCDFALNIGLAKLFNDTGWYMFERGLPEELQSFAELALKIGEQLKARGGDEEVVGTVRESHSYLGMAGAELNNITLNMFHVQKWLDSLLERESAPGVPVLDYELGYAYNEIGVAYGFQNQVEEAAQAFLRSIEIFQGLSDYDDTMLGWPKPNLGFMYWLQGKLEDAERAFLDILDIHAAAWGVDDTTSFKTGKILYGMGNVLGEMQRFDESFNFHHRCLRQYKKTLGLNHQRTGDICHRLACHYIRQGAYKKSEEYFDVALKIFNRREYLVSKLARTSFCKGRLLGYMKRDTEANELLSKAYQMREKLKPDDIRPLEELEEKDFDILVEFWSR
ncbi:hypothetical protein N7490_012019 [Penicillium lividum]|nr:hypothetical protein N7490_012019 [Penicillium lividum]